VTRCIFQGNAAAAGGGLHVAGTSSPNLTNCVFRGNSVTGQGGGLATQSSPRADQLCLRGQQGRYTWRRVLQTVHRANSRDQLHVRGQLGQGRRRDCLREHNAALHQLRDLGQHSHRLCPADLRNHRSHLLLHPGRPRRYRQHQRRPAAGQRRPTATCGCGPDRRASTRGNNAALPAGAVTDVLGLPRFQDDPSTADCRWVPGTCGTAPIVDMGAVEFMETLPARPPTRIRRTWPSMCRLRWPSVGLPAREPEPQRLLWQHQPRHIPGERL
jgi:predicted outer membrane repeat protein